MQIENYTRPQSTITQIKRAAGTPPTTRRNPLIIGPQYKLALNDGRALKRYDVNKFFLASGANAFAFIDDGVSVPVSSSAYAVDTDFVKVFGKNLKAIVSSDVDLAADTTSQLSNYTEVYLTTANKCLAYDVTSLPGSWALHSGLNSRRVAIGDWIKTTQGGLAAYHQVANFLPATTATAISAGSVLLPVTAGADAATAASKFTVSGSSTSKRAYRMRVVVTGVSNNTSATVSIYRSGVATAAKTGLAVVGTATPTTVDGISLTLTELVAASSKVAVGQEFYFDVPAATVVSGVYSGVAVRSYFAPDSGADTLVCQSFTGRITAEHQQSGAEPFTVTANGITPAAGLSGTLGLPTTATGGTAFAPFDGVSGSLSTAADNFLRGWVEVEFRAAVIPGEDEDPIVCYTDTDLAQLGEINDHNWLAAGAYEALTANVGGRVYALRTAGDTLAAFEAALLKVRHVDRYAELVPMTNSLEVAHAVAAHCVAQSQPKKKNFRRCFFGVDSPGSYKSWGRTVSGELRQRYATLSGGYLRLDQDGSSRFTSDVVAVGDVIAFTHVAPNLQFVVLGVQDELTLMVESISTADSAAILLAGQPVTYAGSAITFDGVTETIATPQPFYIMRASTPDNVASYVAGIADEFEAYESRARLVWCDNPRSSGVARSNKYAAAHLAGLRCALLPQQGLSMWEITCFDSAPSMYRKFDQDTHLDRIASHGVMIITQDSPGGVLYVRHQLTTTTSLGKISYEDHVGVVTDEVSYAIKDIQAEWIGKRNVHRDSLILLRRDMVAALADLKTVPLEQRELGPVIVDFFDADGTSNSVTITPNPTQTDRVSTYTRVRVSMPFNGIDNYVDVDISSPINTTEG